ncbi:hypothetical protein TRIP_C20276 [Candidatus Zixiibacteriota bacterium]|nr:hypothetical protein TRIP_C20276 [candidate division Zixibacteria bacterium]
MMLFPICQNPTISFRNRMKTRIFVYPAILILSATACLPPAIYYGTTDDRYHQLKSDQNHVFVGMYDGINTEVRLWGRITGRGGVSLRITNTGYDEVSYLMTQLTAKSDNGEYAVAGFHLLGEKWYPDNICRLKKNETVDIIYELMLDESSKEPPPVIQLNPGKIDIGSDGRSISLGEIVFRRQ